MAGQFYLFIVMGKTFKINNSENGFRKFRHDKNFKKSKKFKHLSDISLQKNHKKNLDGIETVDELIVDEPTNI